MMVNKVGKWNTILTLQIPQIAPLGIQISKIFWGGYSQTPLQGHTLQVVSRVPAFIFRTTCSYKSFWEGCSVREVKLPKLVITKFNGTYVDWPRFWGQYCKTIEKTNVPPVTKFAYLRELLDVKVRKIIKALHIQPKGTPELYQSLKTDLGSKVR